jgi:hypothetical protein
MTWGKYYQVQPSVLTYGTVVARQPGKAVLDLPLFTEANSFLPYFYHKSIVDGSAHWLGNTPQSVQFLNSETPLSLFDCSNLTDKTQRLLSVDEVSKLKQTLLQNDIQTIVLHKDSRLYWTTCTPVLNNISQLLPSMMTAKETLEGSTEDFTIWGQKRLNSGLFFPRNGQVIIAGVSVEGYNGPLQISLGDTPFNLESYAFTQGDQQITYTLKPGEGQFLRVKAGATFQVTGSDQTLDRGKLTIWYVYKPEIGSQALHFSQDHLENIYSDTSTEVFRLIP